MKTRATFAAALAFGPALVAAAVSAPDRRTDAPSDREGAAGEPAGQGRAPRARR